MAAESWFDSFPERRGTDSEKWADVPAGVIPMFVADMDFRSPQCVIDALRERTEHGMYGYSMVPDSFYDAFISWERRIHGCTVAREEILLSAGVITGLQWSMKALTPEKGALIFHPSYPPFMGVPKALGKPLFTLEMEARDGKWAVDFDAFERLAAGGEIDAFILCNPHNPTGRSWTREELTRMLSICKAHGITVYSDEIHGDIVMPGEEFVSVLSLPAEIAGEAVVLTAPSKTFNLPGLQTSCIVVRSAEKREKIAALMGNNHIPGPTFMGITAATAAYRDGEEWMREMNRYVSGNFDLMTEFFARKLPQVSFIRPQATYLAWLDFRAAGLSSEELDRRLIEAGVRLGKGTNYGEKAGEGYMRLTAACPRSLLSEALSRIEKALS